MIITYLSRILFIIGIFTDIHVIYRIARLIIEELNSLIDKNESNNGEEYEIQW